MRTVIMNRGMLLVLMLTLAATLPTFARGKKHPDRAMIEEMESVPCGATEKGITGLGAVWASIGVTKVNTNEKLCPQYLLRTDDMEYHVRPLDKKHLILPIGHEGEFKISKNIIKMKLVDGDHHTRDYQIVAMKQIEHPAAIEPAKQDASRKDYTDKRVADKSYTDRTAANPVNSNSPHPPN
jgi:hypothetical protein